MEYWLVYMERQRQLLALASTVRNNTQITWLLQILYPKVPIIDNYWNSDYLFLWHVNVIYTYMYI